MTRIRIYHLYFLLVVVLTVDAQDGALVRGKVVDAVSQVALVGVHIRQVGGTSGAISGKDGSFRIPMEKGRAGVLELSFVGYATLQWKVSAVDVGSGASLFIELTRRAVELDGVTITRPAPEVVYQREDLHVGDYHANDEGLWVLTYEKPQLWHKQAEAGAQVFREARLHLLDANFIERCSVRLPGEVVRLHRDHSNRTLIEGTSKAWMATMEDDEIMLRSMELRTLRDELLPWTDSIAGALLGSTRSSTYPAFEHIAYNVTTQQSNVICAVQDDHTMELFRSQYKYMSGRDKVIAMDLAIETGIESEIIAGYMTAFYNDPYFTMPYAPLFVVNDTLCIFDHSKGTIHRMTKGLQAVDEIPITYQVDRAWQKRLLQDRSDGSVYALFAKNFRCWLRKVDPATGTLGSLRMLTHPYPEEVQVLAGNAYYVYRPYGSLQHRTLYREAIR